MSIFHMYTGDDGQSHIEEPALSAQPSQEAPQATQEIFFRELPAGTAMDWHNAPPTTVCDRVTGPDGNRLSRTGRSSAVGREMPCWPPT